MLAPRRLGAATGLALMAIGAVGPWASAHTWMSGTVQVSGADHGAALVLGCAALALALLLARRAGAAAACGAVAGVWTTLALSTLPGSLLGNGTAWQADVAWGGYAALAGSLLLTATAWRRRVARRGQF